jgi:putative ABC transport system ATP-binding protein
MALIEVENLRKTYVLDEATSVNVLRGISLQIEAGEFVAIMGPSGSGKSTLMHILGFLDRPSSGRYLFSGKNVTNLSDNDLAEIRNLKVGFVFQAFNLLARTSALENVIVPMLYARDRSASQMHNDAVTLLTEVGLSERMDHEPARLSGGQQQRVAIARALANDPKIIFADEPTGNLDSKSSAEIMKLFSDLNAAGHTLIFVTHDKNVSSYARRVLQIKDGEIISDKKS